MQDPSSGDSERVDRMVQGMTRLAEPAGPMAVQVVGLSVFFVGAPRQGVLQIVRGDSAIPSPLVQLERGKSTQRSR